MRERRQFFGCQVEVLRHEGPMMRCRLPCVDGGCGLMTCWEVFPGICLMFHEFYAQTCFSGSGSFPDMMEFNYCTQGRYECQFENHAYAFLGPGEMAVNTMERLQKWSGFPLGEYHGLSLVVDLPEAGTHLRRSWPELDVDLQQVRQRFCGQCSYYQCRVEGVLRNCLDGMYQPAPQPGQLVFYQLRTLELLSHLQTLPIVGRGYKGYMPPEKRDLMEQVRATLEGDLEGRLTLETVAARHGVGLTNLKQQFQSVFGMSPMAFRKQCRMRQAARLLRETDWTVGEIAGRLGYENASKFAHAFHQAIGLSPSDYRRQGGAGEMGRPRKQLG